MSLKREPSDIDQLKRDATERFMAVDKRAKSVRSATTTRLKDAVQLIDATTQTNCLTPVYLKDWRRERTTVRGRLELLVPDSDLVSHTLMLSDMFRVGPLAFRIEVRRQAPHPRCMIIVEPDLSVTDAPDCAYWTFEFAASTPSKSVPQTTFGSMFNVLVLGGCYDLTFNMRTPQAREFFWTPSRRVLEFNLCVVLDIPSPEVIEGLKTIDTNLPALMVSYWKDLPRSDWWGELLPHLVIDSTDHTKAYQLEQERRMARRRWLFNQDTIGLTKEGVVQDMKLEQPDAEEVTDAQAVTSRTYNPRSVLDNDQLLAQIDLLTKKVKSAASACMPDVAELATLRLPVL